MYIYIYIYTILVVCITVIMHTIYVYTFPAELGNTLMSTVNTYIYIFKHNLMIFLICIWFLFVGITKQEQQMQIQCCYTYVFYTSIITSATLIIRIIRVSYFLQGNSIYCI